MDPVSHVALGRTLIGLVGSDRRTRGMVGAAVLGALAPDVDAVVMPAGWDRYLRVHELGTHAIVGAVGCAVLTALVVRLKRRAAPLSALFVAALIGTSSHLALDLASSARLRPLWPFSPGYASVPLVAMADPYLLALLVLGAILVLTRPRQRERTAASASIAVVAVFLAVKGMLALSAIRGYEATAGTLAPSPSIRIVEARWARLREWTVLDRAGGEVRSWRAIAGEPRATPVLRWPIAPLDQLPATWRQLSTVRNFLAAHDLPVVTTTTGAAGRGKVLFSDLRYCWDPSTRPAPSGTPVALLADGRRLACGLWFGGELDEYGQPVQEVVNVGTLTQTRAPRRE